MAARVQMPNRERVASQIRDLNVFRYWVVSLFYVLSFAIAACCFGAIAVLLITAKPQLIGDLYKLVGLFCTGGASGGFGAFLIKIDQEERKNIRLQQLVDTLLASPNADNLKLLVQIICRYLGLPPESQTPKDIDMKANPAVQ
jgi:hypothetical protein